MNVKDVEGGLRRLEERVKRCVRCGLSENRLKAVPGEGPVDAVLMLVGEGPGREEDRAGRPFVGRAGGLLDLILEASDIRREDTYITNVVKCRPPGNRAPRKNEMEACKPHLDRQIELIDPGVVVLLGGVALKSRLGIDRVGDVHGTLVEQEGRIYVPTYHPAAALRFPLYEDRILEDFKSVKEAIETQ